MSNDYQQYMDQETESVDQMGNDAALAANVSNFGAGTEQVREVQDNGDTYIKTQAKFGVLPGMQISLDHALGREQYFRQQMEHTRSVGPGLPMMSRGKIESSAALTSQREMLANYQTDAAELPNADRDFNLFAPLATMAARSVVKADTVGKWTGNDLDVDPRDKLDAKEEKALGGAVHKEGLDDADSIALASRDVMANRRGLVGASHFLAATVQQEVLDALRGDLDKATGDKAAIESKIESIANTVGYLEKAGALISGGAGLATLAGGASGADAASATGDVVGGGGGLASSVVTMGVQLYYADELAKIQAKINDTVAELETRHKFKARDTLKAATSMFEAAEMNYRTSVMRYEAAIAKRRGEMARIGKAADHAVDRKGADNDTSDTTLWMTTLLETQSFMATAVDAGKAAQATIDTTYAAMAQRRNTKWAKVEDIWGSNDRRPQQDGMGGADAKKLGEMRKLTQNWMDSAQPIQQAVDASIDGKVRPTLEQAGYSGKY